MITNNIQIGLINKNTDNTNSNRLSLRFKRAVSEFISIIKPQPNNQNSYQINQILITLSYLLQESVSISSIIDHYPRFNDTSTNLFGGFNSFLKKLCCCNNKTALNLIIQSRIDYFIRELTLSLIGEEFSVSCTDRTFKAEFTQVLKLIIINLHDNYQFKDYSRLYMGDFDFQNYKFDECDFRHSNWNTPNIKNITFNDCNCSYSRLAIAGENIQFIRCRIELTNFVHADLRQISFYDSSFSTTQFNSELELSEYLSFYEGDKLVSYQELINKKKLVGCNYYQVHTFAFVKPTKDIKILLDIKKHIFDNSSEQLTALENILQLLVHQNNVETDLPLNDAKVKLIAECMISPELPLSSDNICGILNGNALQLYHADSLWAWLVKNPCCPKTRTNIGELWKQGLIFNKHQINQAVEKTGD